MLTTVNEAFSKEASAWKECACGVVVAGGCSGRYEFSNAVRVVQVGAGVPEIEPLTRAVGGGRRFGAPFGARGVCRGCARHRTSGRVLLGTFVATAYVTRASKAGGQRTST